MKKLRCVAIDDEPLALAIIAEYCNRHGDIEISTYSDPQEGLSALGQRQPDVVMMDIDLGDKNGIELARQLPEGTCLIFTTAYVEYAKEGFDMDAVDYLHKPFSYERFCEAVGRARRRLGQHTVATDSPRTIVVKEDYSNVSIEVDDIIYIEAMENYVKIFRSGGGCTISRTNLKNIMSMLPEEAFVRIHRSYVVAVGRVASYTRRRVELVGGVVLPVGRLYTDELLARLQ